MSRDGVRRRRSPARLVFVLVVVAGLLAVTSHPQLALVALLIAIAYAAVEAVIAWRRRPNP